MTDKDLKQIKELITEIIKPLLKEVALIDPIRIELGQLHKKVDLVTANQEMTNDRLDALEDKMDSLSADVHVLQDQNKAILDKTGMFHSRNKREIDQIKRHLKLRVIPDIPEA